MKPFYLDIQDGVIVDLNALGPQKIVFQELLVLMFDGLNLPQSLLIVHKAPQLLKFHGIQLIPVADPGGNPVRQQMVAVEKPPPESDAVGLIVKFLRIDLIEFVQLILL